MQNTVGFASENNGISEATHHLFLLSQTLALYFLYTSVAQQRCARCSLTRRVGVRELLSRFFFFFFTKTVSSLPFQAAEIEELSYVKKHCPRVFFI